MYRSVTESRRVPTKRRILYWAEGLVVAVGVLLLLGFAWLIAAPGT